MLYVAGSISTKTGRAPRRATQLAVEKNVYGVVITTSPGPIPSAIRIIGPQLPCASAVNGVQILSRISMPAKIANVPIHTTQNSGCGNGCFATGTARVGRGAGASAFLQLTDAARIATTSPAVRSFMLAL